jgi:hypothetical protein
MPQVGFEPTILAFEREKTVHALGRAATVIVHPKEGSFVISGGTQSKAVPKKFSSINFKYSNYVFQDTSCGKVLMQER